VIVTTPTVPHQEQQAYVPHQERSREFDSAADAVHNADCLLASLKAMYRALPQQI